MKAAAIAAALGLVAFAAPALADWEYTHWGMSPADLRASSGGRAHPPKTPDPNWLLQVDGGYAAFGARFHDAEFRFDNGRLTQVSLSGGGELDPMLAAMKSAFGPPTRQDTVGLKTYEFDDRAHGNAVQLLFISPSDGGVVLRFAPIGYHWPGD